MRWGSLYREEKLFLIGVATVIVAGVVAGAFAVSKYFFR